jgi:hypothetical protein
MQPFLTLRNNKWTGGDVTISADGDFVVVELRDITPIKGYVLVDLRSGKTVKGHYASLHEAQLAAIAMRKE